MTTHCDEVIIAGSLLLALTGAVVILIAWRSWVHTRTEETHMRKTLAACSLGASAAILIIGLLIA
jgi:hypothetical protein